MRSIIFNQEMMKAWLAGQKTVTRRPLKKQPPEQYQYTGMEDSPARACFKLFGKPPLIPNPTANGKRIRALWPPFCGEKAPFLLGETIYLRETWAVDDNDGQSVIFYKATDHPDCGQPWRPSIHMPEKFAREFALIKLIRPERIQEITEDEVKKEGISIQGLHDPQNLFQYLWEFIYPGTWEKNIWVWRIELERINRLNRFPE